MPVGGGAEYVPFELQEQAGYQVDGAAELRHFLQVKGHPEIILGAVQAHPGHWVFARDVVGVVRLVLVPEQGKADPGHGAPAGEASEDSQGTCVPCKREGRLSPAALSRVDLQPPG